MLTFDDIDFGNATMAGFDPTHIQSSDTQAQSFADLKSNMTSIGGGASIAFDSTHPIQIGGAIGLKLE